MNLFKFLKDYWPTVRKWLVKIILKEFLPKVIAGPWAWIATFFGETLLNRVIKPLWYWFARKGYSLTRRFQRKPRAKRFENADNENDFNNSFDDMP